MHHWQDTALAVILVILNIALIPSVRNKKDKPALATSLITIACLAVVFVVYISLSLWFATIFTAVNILLWTILAVQKYNQKRGR